MRSLVERVAESAGLTYSDAIRLLIEEALAARAGGEPRVVLLKMCDIMDRQAVAAQEIAGIQRALNEKIDAMQGQIERVLDLLAEEEVSE